MCNVGCIGAEVLVVLGLRAVDKNGKKSGIKIRNRHPPCQYFFAFPYRACVRVMG